MCCVIDHYPLSFMHRCLLISEVVVNIAQEIVNDDKRWEKPTAWDSLAKLARTCRMFSEPSLDLLWRAQGSLIPLLRTMPADLWRVDDEILVSPRPGPSISIVCLM